jgi:hypothetical protein
MRDVEGFVHRVDQVEFLAQFRRGRGADALVKQGIVAVLDDETVVGQLGFAGRVQKQPPLVQVVDTLEVHSHSDGPGEGTRMDAEFALEFVEQGEGLVSFAVELVDEGDHRRRTHAADVHQFARLFLDALRRVDDEDHAVHRRQRSVGVLREILVSGCIENGDLAAVVLESHDRGGDRDAALLLDLHEIRRGRLADLVALYRAGGVYGAAEEQQLLGERGLARVGVADDAESAPALEFVRFQRMLVIR